MAAHRNGFSLLSSGDRYELRGMKYNHDWEVIRRESETSMGSNLGIVIIALLREAGEKGLSKTQLMKLVFFVDLEAARGDGATITECNYKTDQYGVVDFGIWDRAVQMAASAGIQYLEHATGFGNPMYRVILVKDEYEPTPGSIKQIIDVVWGKYGGLTASQLGGLTKTLVPMDDEWEINIPVDVRDIAYEESPEFEDLCEYVKKHYPADHSEVKPIDELLERTDKCD